MADMTGLIATYNPSGFSLANQQAKASLEGTQAQTSEVQANTDRIRAEVERQNRDQARAEHDRTVLQDALAKAHGAKNPTKAMDEALIKGGVSPKAYQDWTTSQAAIGAHILTQEREKNALSVAKHKRAADLIGGMLAEATPEAQQAAYQVAYPMILESVDPEEAHQIPTPDQFNPAEHGTALRTIGGALDIAAAQTDAALKKQNAKKAELDAIEGKRQADFVAKDPEGLTPQQRAQASDKKADNDRAAKQLDAQTKRDEERITAQAARDAETARHNLASEERLARVAALAASKDSREKPLPTQAVKILDERTGLADQMSDLNDRFKPEYAGHTLAGGLGNTVGELTGGALGANPDQVEWWKSYQNWVNDVRKKLFGSALTATEKGEFTKAIITPRTDPKIAADFLAEQKRLADKALARETNIWEKGGYNKDQIGEFRRGAASDAPTAAPATAVIVQHSPSTGAYRHSADGGKTWKAGQP